MPWAPLGATGESERHVYDAPFTARRQRRTDEKTDHAEGDLEAPVTHLPFDFTAYDSASTRACRSGFSRIRVTHRW